MASTLNFICSWLFLRAVLCVFPGMSWALAAKAAGQDAVDRNSVQQEVSPASTGAFEAKSEAGGDGEEEDAEEKLAYERFLAVLRRRPAVGTALDRVYSYHQERGTLDEFCDSLKAEVADSEDGAAPLIVGLLRLRQGNEPAAIEALEQAEKLRSTDAVCSWTLGKALVASSRHSDAVAAFERALTKNPTRADRLSIFVDLGRAARIAGGSQQAVAIWKRLEVEQPDDVRVLEIIASVAMEEGDLQTALERYESLAEKSDDEYKSTQFRLKAATIRMRLGERDVARRALEGLLDQLDSESWLYRDVREQLEASFLDAGDSSGLITWFESRLQKQPDELSTMIRLSELLARQGRTDDASQWYSKAIAAAPSNVELRESLIDHLESSGDIVGAIREYEQLMSVAPRNLDHIEAHGRLWMRRRDVTEVERRATAIRIWTELLKGHEKDADVVRRLADILKSADFTEESLTRYREAIELAPQNPQYRRYLGEYLFQLRRRDEALAVWNEMASGERRSVESLLELSSVLSAHGLKAEAIEALSAACQLRPEFSQLLRLAEMQRSYEVAGQHPLAADSLKAIDQAGTLAESDEDRILVLQSRMESLTVSGQLSEVLIKLQQRRNANEVFAAEDWMLLAMCHRELSQNAEAIQAVEEGLEKFAESAGLWQLASTCYETAGRLSDAVTANQRLLKLDRRLQQEYLVRIASLQKRLGQLNEAMETGRALLAVAPGNLEHAQWFAQLSVECGQPEEGLRVIRRLSRAAPEDNAARMALANVLQNRQLNDEAFDVLWDLFLKADDDSDRDNAIRQLSQLALQLGRFIDVIQRLNGRLEQNENDRAILLGLAEAHVTAEDLISARAILERLSQREDRNVLVLRRLAEICERIGDHETSAMYRKSIFRLEPVKSNEETLILALQRAGMFEEAEGMILTHVGPETPAAEILQMIDNSMGEGSRGVARRLCGILIDRNQSAEFALLRLGILQWTDGEANEARATFRRLLEVTEKGPVEKLTDSVYPGKEAIAVRRFHSPSLLNERLGVVRVLLWLEEISEEETQYVSVPNYNDPTGLRLNSTAGRGAVRIALSEMRSIAAVREFALCALFGTEGDLDNVGSDSSYRSPNPAVAAWDRWVLETRSQPQPVKLETLKQLAETGVPDGLAIFLKESLRDPPVASQYWQGRSDELRQRLTQVLADFPDAAFASLSGTAVSLIPGNDAVQSWISELTEKSRTPAQRLFGLLIERAAFSKVPSRWSISEYRGLLEEIFEGDNGFTRNYISPGKLLGVSTPQTFDEIRWGFLCECYVRAGNAVTASELLSLAEDWAQFAVQRQVASVGTSLMPSIVTAQHPQFVSTTQSGLGATTQATVRLPAGRSAAPQDLLMLLTGDRVDQIVWQTISRVTRERPELAREFTQQQKLVLESSTGDRRFFLELAQASMDVSNSQQSSAAIHLIRALAERPNDVMLRWQIALILQQYDLKPEAIAVLEKIPDHDLNDLKFRERSILELAVQIGDTNRAKLALERLSGIALSRTESELFASTAEKLELASLAATLRERAATAQASAVSSVKTPYDAMEEYVRLGNMPAAAQIAKQIARKKIGDASYNFRQQNQRSPFQMRERAFQVLKDAGVLESMIADQQKLVEASPNSKLLREDLQILLMAAGRDDEAKQVRENSAAPSGPESSMSLEDLLEKGTSDEVFQWVLKKLREPGRRADTVETILQNKQLRTILLKVNRWNDLLLAYCGSSKKIPRRIVVEDETLGMLLRLGLSESLDTEQLLPGLQAAYEYNATTVGASVYRVSLDPLMHRPDVCRTLLELDFRLSETRTATGGAADPIKTACAQMLLQSLRQMSTDDRQSLYQKARTHFEARPSWREGMVFLTLLSRSLNEESAAIVWLQKMRQESAIRPFSAGVVSTLNAETGNEEADAAVLDVMEATLSARPATSTEGAYRTILFEQFIQAVRKQGKQYRLRKIVPVMSGWFRAVEAEGLLKPLLPNDAWLAFAVLTREPFASTVPAPKLPQMFRSIAGSLHSRALIEEWQGLQSADAAGISLVAHPLLSTVSVTNGPGRYDLDCEFLKILFQTEINSDEQADQALLKIWQDASAGDHKDSTLFLCTAVLLLRSSNREVSRTADLRLREMLREKTLFAESVEGTSDYASRAKSLATAGFVMGNLLTKTSDHKDLGEAMMDRTQSVLETVSDTLTLKAMAQIRGEFLRSIGARQEAEEEFRQLLELTLRESDGSSPVTEAPSRERVGAPEADKAKLLEELRKAGLSP